MSGGLDFKASVDRDPDGSSYTIQLRVQLSWMDFSVARAYFRRNILPWLRRNHPDTAEFQLHQVTILRENYHSRVIKYKVSYANSPTTGALSGNCGFAYSLDQCQLVNRYAEMRAGDMLETLRAALLSGADRSRPPPAVFVTNVIAPTTCFDFWEKEDWWKTRISDYWFNHPYRKNSRRIVHLLNQLMRVLRQLYRVDVATALKIIRRLSNSQIDLINAVFVEPINGSLIASHLSTIFMHNKQQTGLNMKHEANKLLHLEMKCLRSERDFDPKIYLKMCTSCVKRDIFEIMISVRLDVHFNSTGAKSSSSIGDEETVNGVEVERDSSGTNNNRSEANASARNEYIFCLCHVCSKLRSLANAWRYYDCADTAWVRFEFPRKIYYNVCELLREGMETMKVEVGPVNGGSLPAAEGSATTVPTSAAADTTPAADGDGQKRPPPMQLIFVSDKNEFVDERSFIDNFINYYAFYENGQHPLVIDQCTSSMRNIVSVLYVFATINWVMIVESRKLNQSNSISMNQQSLCKSRNNPLYSAFSENCINRVRAEKVRRVIRENAAYIDRGLGIVSNTGVNAFNVSHTLRRVPSTTAWVRNLVSDMQSNKK
jgi:hypothetical protein